MKNIPLVLVTLALALPVEAQQLTADLAGRWKYNEARSDRVSDKLPPDPYFATAMPGQPPRSAGQDSGRRVNRSPTGVGMVGEVGLLQAIRNPPERLDITVGGDSVSLTSDRGRTLVLRTDGKKVSEDVGAIRMERNAQWRRGDLVVEEKVKDGGMIRYTFRFDQVLKRLTVLARYSGPRYSSPIEIRRVYDRVGDEGLEPPTSRM